MVFSIFPGPAQLLGPVSAAEKFHNFISSEMRLFFSAPPTPPNPAKISQDHPRISQDHSRTAPDLGFSHPISPYVILCNIILNFKKVITNLTWDW